MSADPTDIHQQLLVFCQAAFAKREEHQTVAIVLFFAPGGGFKDDSIRTWMRTETPEMFEDLVGIDKLVQSIIEVAENDVNAKPPGAHRYYVKTKQHGSGYEKHSFTLKPQYNGDEMALATIGGGVGSPMKLGDGVVAAAQVLAGNNAALMRTNTQMFEAAFRPMMQINSGLLDELRATREELSRVQRELEAAKSNNTEREWKIAMEHEKNQRMNAAVQTGLQVAKVVAAKIGGISEGGTPALVAGMQLVSDFAQSLTPPQMEAIMGVLEMSQKIMLMEILKSVLPQQQAEAPAA